MKSKIIIVGGTGFVGQGIIRQLNPEKFEVHSFSRHTHEADFGDETIYHAVELANSQEWLKIVRDADWVIDAVGILLPNPIKKQNYKNSSYDPAKYLIDGLVHEQRPKFLFISANAGPFFMNPYLRAKRKVESRMQKLLTGRAYAVYPGIIFDKTRFSSYILGLLLTRLTAITYVKKLRPISRKNFSAEIEHILSGAKSPLEEKVI